MKSAVFFMAGAAFAAGTMMMLNPVDMKRMKRRCRYAKRMIGSMM